MPYLSFVSEVPQPFRRLVFRRLVLPPLVASTLWFFVIVRLASAQPMRLMLANASVRTLVGRQGVYAPFSDGVGSSATFHQPVGVALDSSGALALVVSMEEGGDNEPVEHHPLAPFPFMLPTPPLCLSTGHRHCNAFFLCLAHGYTLAVPYAVALSLGHHQRVPRAIAQLEWLAIWQSGHVAHPFGDVDPERQQKLRGHA
jgi:hypothetical protein